MIEENPHNDSVVLLSNRESASSILIYASYVSFYVKD